MKGHGGDVVIDPFTWLADRLSAKATGYPRVIASHDCDHCGVRQGGRHRLAGCEGNERDVQRGFLVDFVGEELSDEEVDRRLAAALEQHRRNTEGDA